MVAAIYPPGKPSPQADAALELSWTPGGNVSLTIHADGMDLSAPVQGYVKPNQESKQWGTNGAGVLDLQRRATLAVAEELGVSAANPPVYIQRYASPIGHKDHVAELRKGRQGTWEMLSPPWIAAVFLGVFAAVSSGVVREKEYRLRQSLEATGLTPAAYYTAWVLRTLLANIVWIGAVTGLFFGVGVWYNSNAGLVLLFFLLATVAVTFAGFAFAALFNEARLVAVVAVLVHGVFVGIGALAASRDDSHQASAACLLPGAAFLVGIKGMYQLENDGDGLTFASIGDNLDHHGLPAMLTVFLLLLFDCVLYGCIAWYLDQVLPGALGVTRPWNFFLSRSYWCPHFVAESAQAEPEAAAVEPEEQRRRPSGHVLLSVRGLRRDFGDFTAVRNLDLDLRQGEVLSLLGHNGAGKSTTIRLLTGQDVPTRGTVSVRGEGLQRGGLKALRDTVGVCPQHDVLFDGLTAREHVLLVGALKGIPGDQLEQQADELLAETGLAERADAMATALSGGQKRKLAVAMAFLGGSQLVFLDEPTSGMDPVSRRSVWAVVRQRKQDCAVVLTTHFMDEADSLGDRICVLHRGSVCAEGHSLELKERFGAGYTLIAALQQGASAKPLAADLQTVCPGLSIKSQYGGEVTFQLPPGDDSVLPDVLERLEERAAELGVSSYGVSMTTLEDVFLRLVDQGPAGSPPASPKQGEKPGVPCACPEASALLEQTWTETPATDIAAAEPQLCRVCAALFYKRLCYARRDRQGMAFQLLFPLLFFVLAGILYKGLDQDPDPIYTRRLDASLLPPTAVYVGTPGGAAEQEVRAALQGAAPLNWDYVSVAELPALANTSGANRSAGALEVPGLPGAANATVLFNASASYALPVLYSQWSYAAVNLTGQTTLVDFPPNPAASRVLGPILLLLCTMIGASFIPSSYAAFIVKEREVNVAFLQFASGVPHWLYWLSNFLWDSLSTVVCSTVCIAALGITGAITGSDFGAALLCMMLYCFTGTPFAYICSFIFKQHSKAQIGMAGLQQLLCLTAITPDLTVMMINGADSAASRAVTLVFVAMNPLYALVKVFGVLTNFMAQRDYLDEKYPHEDVLGMNHLGIYITVLFIQAGALFAVLCILMLPWGNWLATARQRWLKGDEAKAGRCDSGRSMRTLPAAAKLDEDVAQERAKVESGAAEDSTIVVSGISRRFGDFVAVQPSHFAIGPGRKGECFGLLGANGAGKSTTVKMLTCEVPPSHGDALLRDRHGTPHSVCAAPGAVQRSVGLCPQFDALLPELTGREWLTFFASIKGIPQELREHCVVGLMQQVGITQYADRPCGRYSGGNRRKLSLAIALMGRPPVVFLDEPSTGVDPKARRGMWDLIRSVASERSVVLTSHSMEEVDALCDRVGIMSQGRMIHLGTPQHLRSRSGGGYLLQAATGAEEDAGRFVDWALSTFPGSSVTERCGRSVSVSLPAAHVGGLAALFRTLRDEKRRLGLESYAVSQTTLEQVFLDTVRRDEAGGSAEARHDRDAVDYDDVVKHFLRFFTSVFGWGYTFAAFFLIVFFTIFGACFCLLGFGIPLLNLCCFGWRYIALGYIRLLTAVDTRGGVALVAEMPQIEGGICTKYLCHKSSWASAGALLLCFFISTIGWALSMCMTIMSVTFFLVLFTMPLSIPLWWLTTRMTHALLWKQARLCAAALCAGGAKAAPEVHDAPEEAL
eukprot:TRINITY_DN45_c0_g1_i1.p1 TRINITY_DN45_c0_g1~~TRINITY_DN45_c0_g1_i1.p1  ORF type:complete len:1842 (+),score=630.41 TRINITY_DN45_c0_g1_i1:449-5527(+)